MLVGSMSAPSRVARQSIATQDPSTACLELQSSVVGNHYAAMHMWRYFGPCADELQSFADMSAMAIKRWSRGCQVEWASWGCTAGIWHIGHVYQAYFPCRSKFCFREQFRSVQFTMLPGCRRDYQKICPDGWARLGDERKCKPPEDYTGPCRWHCFCDTLHSRLCKEACKGNS
jgi:hypothetical protein